MPGSGEHRGRARSGRPGPDDDGVVGASAQPSEPSPIRVPERSRVPSAPLGVAPHSDDEQSLQLVEHGVGVAHDGEVGHLHHRAVRIGVHADDVVGVAEAGRVLHRAADPEREVERRVDDDAGRADLALVADPSPVGDDARRPHRRAEPGRDRGELFEALGAVESGSAADDAVGLRQVHRGDVGRQQFDERWIDIAVRRVRQGRAAVTSKLSSIGQGRRGRPVAA